MALARATEPQIGTFDNGMEYVAWGRGPKVLLLIPVGPGSTAPTGMMLRMYERRYRPVIAAGFAVWVVTRQRDMPAGHTIADMADDYAEIIDEQFNGRIDIIAGESFGGMIAQYVAARHPEGGALFGADSRRL